MPRTKKTPSDASTEIAPKKPVLRKRKAKQEPDSDHLDSESDVDEEETLAKKKKRTSPSKLGTGPAGSQPVAEGMIAPSYVFGFRSSIP